MHYIAVLDALVDHGGELGQYHSRVYEIHATYVRAGWVHFISMWKEGVCYICIV